MAKKFFDDVNPKVSFPELEEKILKFWEDDETFKKSINQRPADKTWTFLDGPPFITGSPHYGSLLTSIPKDLFPRFWTMRGYRVRRVWGWDCHGLPAENKVENKLGLKSKKEIEQKIGIKRFIEECKLYVSEVSSEWKWYIDHIARWVDFDHAYRTMDLEYMESVMWVFKEMYKKGLIYKGVRVSLYCPHDSTPISNFEVAMDAAENYKEVSEPADVYKYQSQEDKNTYYLAWSTTPWTKLATPALAVNPKLTYVKVKEENSYYILAKKTLGILKTKNYKIIEEFKGSKLVGKKFVPHYDFFEPQEGKKRFVIIPGDFVTAVDGTGIVTIAAYGEDDLKVMLKENIQMFLHVDDEGIITSKSPVAGGMYYLDANEKINQDLQKRGLIYKEEQYTHTVVSCWRCATRLFYKPQDAWYVNVQKLKTQMKKTNQSVNWFPKHFKYGRFLKSLEAAPDWCISRSRYWGSPVPVWECECGERFVPGSIKELEQASGTKINDLHKPDIDEILVKCQKCGKKAKRVPEVLDSWIEAGSASLAERHYPFEKGLVLKDFFPPDFIVEYTGQIRAWFYVLHVISNALFKSRAFKNVLVTGVISGTDGRKMSKNYGNYPDPKETIKKYGGDALRLYLMGTPVMKGEDILISEEHYRNQIKNFLLIFWNTYNYFVTYSNLRGWKPTKTKTKSKNILDTWILAQLKRLTAEVTKNLENYDTISYVENVQKFLNELSTWYLRRSRGRNDSEFFQTFYDVLVTFCKLSAPITPFITEEIYKNLTKEESVHLTDWPSIKPVTKSEEKVLKEMDEVKIISEKIHALRKKSGIPLRQPLSKAQASSKVVLSKKAIEILLDELNLKSIKITVTGTKNSKREIKLDTKITPKLKAEGEMRTIVRKIQETRKKIKTSLNEKVKVSLPDWPKEFEDEIKKRALVSILQKGPFKVERLS